MKAKFQVGAEIDFLTRSELDESLDKLVKGWQAEIARGLRHRKFTAQADVTGATWAIGGMTAPNNQKDALGPSQGFVWSVRRIVVSGPSFTQGTDQFSVFVDDVSATKLVEADAFRAVQWETGGLVLTSPEALALTGTAAGAPSQFGVVVSGEAIEVPIQLTRLLV